MSIVLSGRADALRPGLANLLAAYPYPARRFQGEVRAVPVSEGPSLSVSRDGDCYRVCYRRPCDFFRALGCILCGEAQAAPLTETAAYEKCGAMLDLSRDAVYTLPQMKEFLSWLALCGLNTCYLYMEDTYKLDQYPYFGYLRGAYSPADLKELDDFADSLGIELIPCIQTLSHLATTLRWDYAAPLRDTANTLMVGSEAAYDLIRQMFRQLKGVFRTRRFHIGMDEAGDLGTGVRLRRQGYAPTFELMMQHLEQVCRIAREEGISPMIWDDTFYRAKCENQDYYDPNVALSPEDIARVPDNVSLVYWDYYHTKKEEYDHFLDIRRGFGDRVIFAGGIWKWMGWVPNYDQTFVSTRAALSACAQFGVKEVMATLWGDDGDEAPLACIWPGLVLFGQYAYGADTDDDALSRRCLGLTGLGLADFRAVEQLDLLPGCPRPNTELVNSSKYLLYQDLMLGAFDAHVPDSASGHYRALTRQLATLAEKPDLAPGLPEMLRMYTALSDLLSDKSCFGVQLRRAYQAGDRAALARLRDSLPTLAEKAEQLHRCFVQVWCRGTRGAGLEVHDIRLGGLSARIRTVRTRLDLYLDGTLPRLDELEETILPYRLYATHCPDSYPVCNRWQLIATQNVL